MKKPRCEESAFLSSGSISHRPRRMRRPETLLPDSEAAPEIRFHLYQPVPLIPTDPKMTDTYFTNALRMGISRIFFIAHGDRTEDYVRFAELLRQRIARFEAAGIKVGFWYAPTLGWSPVIQQNRDHPYQQITDCGGRISHGVSCPLDQAFCRQFEENITEIARSGVDCIMLEDDFRLQLHQGAFACFCPLHMERFRQETGCRLSREALAEKILCGAPNELRRQWLAVSGRSLLELAGRLERAVHRVNPDARLGLTAVMSHYSTEGFHIQDLIQALSGPARPFLRTIGAPYWSASPYHAAYITEYTRLQQYWLRDSDIELMAEGDVYPHSSFLSPVSGLTAFLQGLIAAGFPGMLVYPQSYHAAPEHDSAFVDSLLQNRAHFERIRQIFPADAVSLGVTPIETQNNFINLPLKDHRHAYGWAGGWPDEPSSLQVFSRMGIPVAFDSKTAPVVLFGYGAAGFSDTEIEELLSRGALIDGPAAQWLLGRGFDIGLTRIEESALRPAYEHFTSSDFYGPYAGDLLNMACNRDGVYYQAVPCDKAEVLSYYMQDPDTPLFPSVLHYENRGRRVCILPVSMQQAGKSAMSQVIYSYQRAYQLAASLTYIGRRPLDVSAAGAPNLHVLAKRIPAGGLAVMIQNGWLDPAENIVLRLSSDWPVSGRLLLLEHEARQPILTDQYEYVPGDSSSGGRLILRNIKIPPMGAVFLRIE